MPRKYKIALELQKTLDEEKSKKEEKPKRKYKIAETPEVKAKKQKVMEFLKKAVAKHKAKKVKKQKLDAIKSLGWYIWHDRDDLKRGQYDHSDDGVDRILVRIKRPGVEEELKPLVGEVVFYHQDWRDYDYAYYVYSASVVILYLRQNDSDDITKYSEEQFLNMMASIAGDVLMSHPEKTELMDPDPSLVEKK